MNLEAAIQANTKAVEALTAALAGGVITKSNGVAKTSAEPKAETPAPKTEAPAATTSTASVSYDDVKVPFLALVKKNRDLAVATLKPFGLDSLKGAKPEQYAAILEAVSKATVNATALA